MLGKIQCFSGILKLRMDSSPLEATSCEYQVYRRYEGNHNRIEYMQKGLIDKNEKLSSLTLREKRGESIRDGHIPTQI
jgi:hypothetical protein